MFYYVRMDEMIPENHLLRLVDKHIDLGFIRAKVKHLYEEFHPDRVGVVGVVGRAVLNKLGLKADLDFGITRATALAAERGLNVFVFVVGRMVNRVIEEIDTTNVKHGSNITYEVKEGRIASD
jgi:predicted transcriptional regulator